MNRIPLLLIALAMLAAPVLNALAQAESSKTPQQRMVESRAVDAAIWGMPTVSFDALRQAYFHDAKAKYNDIIWWPKGSGWKNQSLTANTTVRYIYIFANTQQNGPVVVELPPANASGSFYGTILDAWQVPLVDIGLGGKGGKYVVLPPGYTGTEPSGYIAVRPATYNTFLGLRSIAASLSEADVTAANALVKQIKVYPLSAAANPVTQHFVDMTDILYSGLVHYDESIYISLARMLNEEPVQPRDLQMMGMLLPLGIEKGKEFKPDAATVAQLKSAGAAAQTWLIGQLPTYITPWWPKSQWNVPIAPIAVKSAFTWEAANYFDVDARGIAFSTFFCPPKKLGGDSFYLGTYNDSNGHPLGGEHAYKLHVPANVPVHQFWAVTVYDVKTSAFFLNSMRLTLDSLDKGMQKNADGSVDIYFGPAPAAGHESNWLLTPSGQAWTPWFRFYGPQKALFDKAWSMPDIEKIS